MNEKPISYSPTAALTYDPADETYWDAASLREELERTFEICHGCRMCFKYCDSFPDLFKFIDGHDGDVRKVTVAQTEQVMENLSTALAAAGATFDDVAKITTFVVDYTPEMRSVIGEVRGRYLPADNPPASTLVGVSALAGPEWLIEIEAIAVTD